jgi:hypothetical protein
LSRLVVTILTPIYESEFLGFSYGFRPKRNQHQALDALAVAKRMRTKLREIKEQLMATRHDGIDK